MKTNAVTFLLALGAFIFSTQLPAQDRPVTFGIKAGANLSNYRLGGAMKEYKSKIKPGGSVGGFVKFNLGTNFALQTGVNAYYNTANFASKTSASSYSFKSIGVEVPLYGIVQGELGSGKGFLGAGPYAGYGIRARSGGVNLYDKNPETGRAAMNRFDYGVGGIIGYDFNKKFQIHASYQFGLADLHEAAGGSMKSQNATIGIGYKF